MIMITIIRQLMVNEAGEQFAKAFLPSGDKCEI